MDISQEHTDYRRIHQLTTTLAGQPVTYFSKPGLPNWDVVTPASRLLAEGAHLSPMDRTLVINASHGALISVLAQRIRAELWATEASHIALNMALKTLQHNAVTNVHLIPESNLLLEGIHSSFDVVLLELPKGRKYARRQLMFAYQALKPGGRFYLAGAKKAGVQSVIKDAEALFGNSTLLGYKKGNRICRSVKSEQPAPLPTWTEEPGIQIGAWFEFQAEIGGEKLPLLSIPGVFSYDRLDNGTRLLLSRLEINPSMRVLDIGCGYGVIGLIAARSAIHVDLVDASYLAVACARANLRRYPLTSAAVFPSDVTESVVGNRYHRVYTNPPFHTGTDVDYIVANAIISQAYDALLPGGEFWLVANRFIRYNRLMAAMFEQIDTISETGQYHLLRGIRGDR